MNGANNQTGRQVGEVTKPQPRTDARSEDPRKLAEDARKLASAISENRAKLRAGWETLERLDEELAALEAKLQKHSSEAPVRPATSSTILSKAA